jgi:quercetin dioxygenase-like cupin family protein
MSSSSRAAALLFATSVACAAGPLPPHAMRNAAPVAPSADFHIAGAGVGALPLAEWETEGPMGRTVQIVWGREAVDKAPANASRYAQKTYSFPTGTIRVLEFRQASGGMIHQVTSETALFMLEGSGTVGVAGRDVGIGAGDAVNFPSGVLRGAGDATVILWTVTGTRNNEDSKSMVVRAADAPVTESAEWDEDGRRVAARTPAELAKAPADAIRLAVRRYEFPGNSVRFARSFKGGPTSPKTGELDSLIYVISGDLRFTQGGHEVHAVPGDAVREIAGENHYWYRVADSAFVAISSLPMVPITPSKR